jgi:hypothetical protein
MEPSMAEATNNIVTLDASDDRDLPGEPHPTDSNKCTFDLWCLVFPVEGMEAFDTMSGPRPVQEAEFEHRIFDGGRGLADMAGQIVFQDMRLAEGQQRGLRSRGYDDSYLAGQETRVARFYEVLNDYIEGRRWPRHQIQYLLESSK